MFAGWRSHRDRRVAARSVGQRTRHDPGCQPRRRGERAAQSVDERREREHGRDAVWLARRELEDVDAAGRVAPQHDSPRIDPGQGARVADGSPQVLALTSDAEASARLTGRVAEMAVVESDNGQTRCGEALRVQRERLVSCE